MKTNAIIWRESIYKNDFKCNCGNRIGSSEGDPIEHIIHDKTDSLLICPYCLQVAAKIKKVDMPDGETKKLQGSWEEFIKKNSN